MSKKKTKKYDPMKHWQSVTLVMSDGSHARYTGPGHCRPGCGLLVRDVFMTEPKELPEGEHWTDLSGLESIANG